MLKQQDCHRLRQNARTLEAVWSSPLAPSALWPLVMAHPLLYADLIRKTLKQSENRSYGPAPGLTQVGSAWPAGKAQTWIELPASWRAPDWLRLERLIPGKAWLAWHYQLQATDTGSEFRLKLEYLLLNSELPAVQAGFKRIGDEIALQLKTLSQTGDLRYPESGLSEWQQDPQATSPISRAARRELSLNGQIDPLRLALQSGCTLNEALEFLEQARLTGLLTVSWDHLEPDQHEGQPADWQAPWQSPLWVSARSGSLRDRGLRYRLPQTERRPLPWSPLSNLSSRLLLWPGQSREFNLTEPQSWALADGSASGRLRLSAGAALAELDLSAPADQLKTSGPLQLRNSSSRLQLLCLRPLSDTTLPSHAGSLLACQAAAGLLLKAWPNGEVQAVEGFMLKLSTALPPALSTGLSLRGGARLNDSLLHFDSLPAALDGAAQLLSRLREALTADLLPEPFPVMALAAGPGLLRRTLKGLSLEAELADTLTQLLKLGRGSDLILSGRLIQDEVCQRWLAGSRWQVIQIEDQNAFQLRPPR